MVINTKNIMKLFIISLLAILVFVLTGCSKNEKDNIINTSEEKVSISATKISSSEAKEIINNEKEIIILDVRTEEEYNSGHIENSLLIPVDDLEKLAISKLVDKEQKILIYCRSGNRSKLAAELLVDLGYTKVYDFGGINSWKWEVVK